MATNLLSQPSLERDLSSPETSEYLPITSIISNDEIGHTEITKEKLIFCYQVTLSTLQAIVENEYYAFDALTTTTCCHGLSLVVRELIIEIGKIDLDSLLNELRRYNNLIQLSAFEPKTLNNIFCSYLPAPIIHLAQLYILTKIKNKDIHRGWRTDIKKLRHIAPISTRFSKELVERLQTYFSNLVAESYSQYIRAADHKDTINNVPLKLWAKYVQPQYVRTDRNKRKYVSALFSMQIFLHRLLSLRAKVALVNDLRSESGVLRSTYVHMFGGQGASEFIPLDLDRSGWDELCTQEPVVVLGGCMYSDSVHPDSLKFRMAPWHNRLSSLILACDTFYPQFPKVPDDPTFDSTPIIPGEKLLKSTLSSHSNTPGVSAKNPSLFCLSHIYVTSIQQLSGIAKQGMNINELESFVPNTIRGSSTSINRYN